MVFVHFKLLNEVATKPTKAHRGDAGYDLYSSEDTVIVGRQRTTIKTGVSLDMSEGMAGLIWPRSGLSVKKGLDVLAGVVDSGYRGEIMVCLYNTSDEDVEINCGDRIAQIIFQEVPLVSLIESEELETSQRGSNGFGSTGI
jgi:deoxyuridine 5'-triphosphate nucleotidohydrolase